MDDKKRIMVVEHDTTLRDILVRKIESGGYHVDYAGNGVVAMEKIRVTKPQVILLELLTPRKSGIEILEELALDPELKKIPVVMIASSSQASEIDRAKEMGVQEFLIKELFNPDEVIEKLKWVLDSGAGILPGGDMVQKVGLPPVEEKAPSPKVVVSTGANIFVLVVEDDKFLRELLVRKLLAEKFTVESAIDAEGAFAILKDKKPDIILLDLILPGVSGFDILARVKADQATADIPVIILSNLGQKEDVDRAKSLGAQDFMVKANFTLDEIVEKVHSVVG
ncbi:MAG: response regulator [Patescibacteria group bacterium]